MNDNLRLKIFGENVKKFRLGKQISQEQLAHLAGLDRTYIGGIERGERNISLLNIVRIASALDIDSRELFIDIE